MTSGDSYLAGFDDAMRGRLSRQQAWPAKSQKRYAEGYQDGDAEKEKLDKHSEYLTATDNERFDLNREQFISDLMNRIEQLEERIEKLEDK